MSGPAPRAGGTLWLVATPIGTLADLSPRACEVLRRCGTVLAEDTRRARKLLSHYEVPVAGRLRSFHEHNEEKMGEWVVGRLRDGDDVALISDAGTPVLSDPGFTLVRRVRGAGLAVLSVPGPSAFAAALAASGQPPLPALLVGFLPPRPGARRRRLEELARIDATLVILLSPHRLGRELADMSSVLGATRSASLMAELSKRHERSATGSLEELCCSPEAENPRGEYVIVVGPPTSLPSGIEQGEELAERVQALYQEAIDLGLERSAALRLVADRLQLKRREVFDALRADR
ncbi:MAG: 16S rRNA (cytidine(1402)-2'-O)-methyltransferase [Acidobacteria bacterium]|nr:16S rRNA (cytidine(1402)-2'-O)-methyltransferase [Acidobacteriota bacterium]